MLVGDFVMMKILCCAIMTMCVNTDLAMIEVVCLEDFFVAQC